MEIKQLFKYRLIVYVYHQLFMNHFRIDFIL